MSDPEFTEALCQLSRRLYRMSSDHLEAARDDLERILRLIQHYQALQGPARPDSSQGAAHLCRDKPKPPNPESRIDRTPVQFP